jgi:hypothetical protein
MVVRKRWAKMRGIENDDEYENDRLVALTNISAGQICCLDRTDARVRHQIRGEVTIECGDRFSVDQPKNKHAV